MASDTTRWGGRTGVAVLVLIAALMTARAGRAADREHKAGGGPSAKAQRGSPAPASPRLYVFDCGTLNIGNPSLYGFTPSDLVTTKMSVSCFLVAHSKGTLMWDTGALPDSVFTSAASVTQASPASVSGATATVTKPLKVQLAEAGYTPADATYLALSHCHWDHTANANAFAGATWLVRQEERDAMFAQPPAFARCNTPDAYGALRNSKSVIIKTDDYDVFGDGTVIIKSAPGHTPGHQVLVLKLRKTGAVMVGGDLYHYPEERATRHVPATDFNVEQAAATLTAIETFLKKTGAPLWIQHDFTGNAKLKKAPAYYE